MFSIGNQIVIKAENKEGFIYSIIDENNYVVGSKEYGMLKMQFLPECELELKPCEFGTNGLCDYVTDISPKGQFACMDCEFKRDDVD